METLFQFIGRFHPLVVHLPIGFLILGFLFEWLSAYSVYKKLKSSVQTTLVFGALFAWAACLTGYRLKQEGGYDDSLANLHQYLGISTAISATALVVFRKYSKRLIPDSIMRKRVRVLAFVPLIILLSFTGHWGGSLTHGEDYLSLSFEEDVSTIDPGFRIRQISNLDTAILFEDMIEPMFKARCFQCHSSKKQKGDLRLDSRERMMKGGKSGFLFATPADSSLLYKRVTLPLEDKHHMPPEESPQLTSTEIDLLNAWIKDGANFEKRVDQYIERDRLKKYLQSYQEIDAKSIVPDEEVDAADPKIIGELKSSGVSILPASVGSNYLTINFTNARSITDKVIANLLSIHEQIIWLDLSFTNISDRQCASLGKLTNLRVLYLNHTAIGDLGIENLTPLSHLLTLSLVNTVVTDSSLRRLSDFASLKNVYLFNSKISRQGIQQFVRHSNTVEVDSGNYSLPILTTDTLIYKKKK